MTRRQGTYKCQNTPASTRSELIECLDARKASIENDSLQIGHYLHYLEPNFKKVTFSDKMKAVAKDLKFQDPIVVQGMYIFKNPRIGGVGK